MPPPTDNAAMTPLKILIVEDRETDTELIVRELKKHGFAPSWIRVDTEEDFLRQIHTPLDLISVDAIMPQFSAHRVLTVLQEHQLDTPCIIISGSIGEEEAVSLIRAGASDYLMKDRLGRLGQSIRQVLDQHRLRREHTRAHNALITLNEELERRIAERTARLEELNHDLAEELLERKQIEQQLREHETALERRVAARTVQLERSYARLRRLASELTLAEQRERKNLASELHDYLAQLLVVSKFKIAQLHRNPSDSNVRSLLQEVDSSLDQALTYSRTLIAHLSPTVLFIQGLVAALHWLPEYFSKQGLQVQVKSHVSTVTLSEDRSILLFQSVRELLFNALKHAGTGEATVEIHVVDKRVLRITVTDDGTGFDGEMLNGDTKGFGLLSIRERIEGLDGTFSVLSSPGAGTRIELSIPLTEVAGPPERSSKVRETEGLSLDPCRVLIVDDHQLLRQELTMLLSAMNGIIIVGEASNGKEAIESAASLSPDAIMMDINMPGLDGIEATRQILAHNPDVKVIGITVHADQDIHMRMMDAGAVASLSKDTLARDLQPTICRILGLQDMLASS